MPVYVITVKLRFKRKAMILQESVDKGMDYSFRKNRLGRSNRAERRSRPPTI